MVMWKQHVFAERDGLNSHKMRISTEPLQEFMCLWEGGQYRCSLTLLCTSSRVLSSSMSENHE